MSSIMQIASFRALADTMQDAIEAAGFAAASGCQVYVDNGQLGVAMLGGLISTSVIRALGPSSAVATAYVYVSTYVRMYARTYQHVRIRISRKQTE